MKKRTLFLLLLLFALPIFGQVVTAPLPLPIPQFFSATGQPLSGGKVYTYMAGTTTPLATYTDNTGTTQNTNPIILNAAGYPTNAMGTVVGIWLGPQKYNIFVQNSSGVQQWSADGVSGNNLFLLSNLSMAESTAPTCSIGFDNVWGDSSGHRLKFCNNGGTADLIVGQNSVDTLTNKTLISSVLSSPTSQGGTFTTPALVTPSFSGQFPISVSKLNGSPFADNQTGADASIKTAAAIAALPATGGVVWMTGFAGNQTISQTINVGDGTKCVTLMVPPGVNFGITITNGTPAIKIFDCSAVIGLSLGLDTNAPRFQLASTAHVSSVVTNDQSGNQASFYLSGVTLYGSPTAIVDNAMLDLSLINNKSIVMNVIGANFPSRGLWIHNSGALSQGDFTFINSDFDGNAVAGAQPCVIEDSGAGSIQDIKFQDGGCEHAGNTLPELLIDGHGGANLSTTRFYGVRFEKNNADTTTEMVRLRDVSGVTLLDPIFAPEAGGDSSFGVTLTETSPGLLRSFRMINGTIGNGNCVNNTILTVQQTGQFCDYTYLSPTFNAGGNKDTVTIGGLTFSADRKISPAIGIVGDSGGLKHKRVTGCTTGATSGNTCTTTVTWTTAFADANYTPVCTLLGPATLGHLAAISTDVIAAASVKVETVTDTNAAITGTVNCIAIHD